MRKMKKVLSLAMTAAMTASLLTGMGAVTASAKKSDDGKRTKITALLKGTESTEQYKTFDYLLKNFCDEKGLDYEIELVNDMQDYLQNSRCILTVIHFRIFLDARTEHFLKHAKILMHWLMWEMNLKETDMMRN